MGAHPDSPQPASHAGFGFVFVLIIFFALTIWPCCLSETHPRSVHSFKYCRWKPALEKSRKSEERSGRHPWGSPGPAQLLSPPQVSLRKARSSVVTSSSQSVPVTDSAKTTARNRAIPVPLEYENRNIYKFLGGSYFLNGKRRLDIF